MKVTIVTPVFNGMPWLPECIQSVAEQRRSVEVEVEHLVFDGAQLMAASSGCENTQLLATRRSSVRMADEIADLAKSPQKRGALGTAGAERARSRYGRETSPAALAAVFDAAVTVRGHR